MRATIEKNVDDRLVQKLPSTQRPKHSIYAAMASQKIVSTDIRVPGDLVETLADEGQSSGIFEFVDDKCDNFIAETLHGGGRAATADSQTNRKRCS